MIWIRFPETGAEAKFRRHHAVLTPGHKDGVGGYWTYCGRFQRYEAVKDTTEAPRARCACCRGRIAHPYLIEPSLVKIAAEQRLPKAVDLTGSDPEIVGTLSTDEYIRSIRRGEQRP